MNISKSIFAIANATPARSDSHSSAIRYALRTVQLSAAQDRDDCTATATATATATDGRMLARIRWDYETDKADSETSKAKSPIEPILIGLEDWKSISILKGPVIINGNPPQARGTNGSSLPITPIDGTFPDADAVIPEYTLIDSKTAPFAKSKVPPKPAVRTTVDIRLLEKLIKALKPAVVAGDTANGKLDIVVPLDALRPVEFKSVETDTYDSYALLMPVRRTKGD